MPLGKTQRIFKEKEVEETWNRRSKLLSLDLAFLTELIQPALPGNMVTNAEVLTAGHSNTNYKLQLSNQAEKFVLRVYMREAEACQKEYNLFRRLHAQIPLAEIIYAEPTGLIFGKPYSIARWVEGVQLDRLLGEPDNALVRQLGQAVGATLGTLGQACNFGQPGFFDPQLNLVQPFPDIADSWRLYIHKCLSTETALQKLGSLEANRLAHFVDAKVVLLENLPVTAALVHGDFKGQNILVRDGPAGWEVAGVLDWEFACSGSPLADFATMLRHNRHFNPIFETAFAEGFSSNGGLLPANWLQLARLLDLVNLADFLTLPTCTGAMLENVAHLIQTTLQEF